MKVAIHQPQYFPYPGFFHKLTLADVFVIMDDVQYDKRFTNRNKIIATYGWQWLTVPINKDHRFLANSLVEINDDLPWGELHWDKMHHSYANSRFFHLYKDYFANIYKRKWEFLFDLNFETLKKTIEWLDIKIKIIKGSELNAKGRATERLVNICKALGADTYVSGRGSDDYLDEKLFEMNNVRLEYQNYVHPLYHQHLAKSFIPNLSIIDMLANVGPESSTLLKESGKFTAREIQEKQLASTLVNKASSIIDWTPERGIKLFLEL